ncbi:MAG: hypothetical protein H7Y27_13595 [Gemmatimonadaceae bacterium]|nr:hypothetical protein [Chitinophagaceae bacterium]
MTYKFLILLLSIMIMLGHSNRSRYTNVAAKVSIRKTAEGYRLYRDGQPYTIKGAGTINGKYLRQLKDAGANSIRIYGTENAQEILDSAQSLDMTVFVGLDVAYAKKELNYKDHKLVARQQEKIKQMVLKLKDHPALLMWGVGNEPGLYIYESLRDVPENIALAKAINNLAKMIHEVDTDHPTVLSVPGGSKSRLTRLLSDEIDIIAYNSFEPFDEQLRKSAWTGPYIITEFGAFGYWASDRTEWYSRIEQTSIEKRRFIRKQYAIFQNDKHNFLGSYAFLWEQKQEYTTTWFSLFTDEGQQTETIDELSALWNGKSAVYSSPSIKTVLVDAKSDLESIYLNAGQATTASITLSDKPIVPVALKWEIERDTIEYLNASYRQSVKKVVASDTLSLSPGNSVSNLNITFRAPMREGPYRIFFYLKNGSGRISTANSCFYVHE